MAAFLVTTFELLILTVILSIQTQKILRKIVKTIEVGLLLNRSIFSQHMVVKIIVGTKIMFIL